MCGRFSLFSEINKILEKFEIESASGFSKSYNVTPSSMIPVIRKNTEKELITCHWGLIPHWVKDKKLKPINARSETLSEKPFFRESFKGKRCFIPANGFYEWQGSKGNKQPYYIKLKNEELFAFAGLWDAWEYGGEEVESCTIITTIANKIMNPIHQRMPVILHADNYDQWLEEGGTKLLKPYVGEMDFFPVSKKMNSPKSDGPELIEVI